MVVFDQNLHRFRVLKRLLESLVVVLNGNDDPVILFFVFVESGKEFALCRSRILIKFAHFARTFLVVFGLARSLLKPDPCLVARLGELQKVFVILHKLDQCLFVEKYFSLFKV